MVLYVPDMSSTNAVKPLLLDYSFRGDYKKLRHSHGPALLLITRLVGHNGLN